VKVPFPVHPGTPVNVHVPLIEFPLTVPCNVSTSLLLENVVEIVMPNCPVTLPLKSPARLKEPVSEVCPEKQLPAVVN